MFPISKKPATYHYDIKKFYSSSKTYFKEGLLNRGASAHYKYIMSKDRIKI